MTNGANNFLISFIAPLVTAAITGAIAGGVIVTTLKNDMRDVKHELSLVREMTVDSAVSSERVGTALRHISVLQDRVQRTFENISDHERRISILETLMLRHRPAGSNELRPRFNFPQPERTE